MNCVRAVAFGSITAAVLMVSGAVSAADPAPAEKTGLKVGEKAPDFKLKDQAGEERSLKALIKDGNVALVFYRSASW